MSSNKKSMNYNSSEQDLLNINYNQTNFTVENTNMKFIRNNSNNELNISGSSNDKSQDLVEIEQKNIHMLILQRSLFIMKKRFEQNKRDIVLIYEKYKDQNYRRLKCISTKNLFNLYKEIMNTIQINLLPYENFNELITADLMTAFNEEKYVTMINALVQFTRKNIEKYNTIFYENKMKKKKMKEQKENEKKEKPQEVDVTDQVKIVRKNKRGEIIDNFESMIEKNKKMDIKDIIFSINEDDMSILTNKKLLYNDVIPLIIADFLQEYMKNNINIGIILSNNGLTNNDNEELNENIKVLYDKEIIKKYNNLNKIDPKEEKTEKLKTLLFESNNIDNQIKIYNELIVENSNKGMESSYLLEMIRKLKEKKIILQKKITEINKKKINVSHKKKNNNIKNEYSYTVNTNIKNINSLNSFENINYQSKLNRSKNNSKNNSRNNSKIHIKLNQKKLSKKEIRDNNLYDIFSFYCKQHCMIGRTPTIDEIMQKEKKMNLSEFAKFCVEFKILVKNNKINEIFKKYTKNPPYMSFEEFTETLKKMAVLVNEEKKQYIKERINIYQLQLQEMIEKEKKKKKKTKKKKLIKKEENENNNEEVNNENKNNEEHKNEDPNVNKQNENPNENNNPENNNNENNENEKKEENEMNNQNNNDENKSENNSSSQKKKETKKDEQIIITTREGLEEKISKLQNDYSTLENKSLSVLEEEFYIYLEIDDSSIYRKKMVGYMHPFSVREKDTRNPDKNVKYPVKFDPKNVRDMYDLLMKRQDELKKEKELKKMKEKDIQYEKRKKKFQQEIKKLEKAYDVRLKKDNYIQIKKSEEDMLKDRNNKLTWQFIQKCDYNTFLMNDDGKNAKKNSIQSQLNDIFVNQSNQYFEKDDEDFINQIYSNQERRQRHNYDEYLPNSKVPSRNNMNYSMDPNKRYKLGNIY